MRNTKVNEDDTLGDEMSDDEKILYLMMMTVMCESLFFLLTMITPAAEVGVDDLNG